MGALTPARPRPYTYDPTCVFGGHNWLGSATSHVGWVSSHTAQRQEQQSVRCGEREDDSGLRVRVATIRGRVFFLQAATCCPSMGVPVWTGGNSSSSNRLEVVVSKAPSSRMRESATGCAPQHTLADITRGLQSISKSTTQGPRNSTVKARCAGTIAVFGHASARHGLGASLDTPRPITGTAAPADASSRHHKVAVV